MSNFISKLNLWAAIASWLKKDNDAAEKTAPDKKLTPGKAASARKAKSEKEASDSKIKTDAQIERINELSKMARGTWFSLLGYLAFVGVTLLAVEDADFFVSTRKTDLPIVNIPIPTASFFIFGPILGTALFVYLHLYLIRLWDALSEADEKIDDTPLSEKVMPWLINDFGLWLRNDDAFKNRPMDWVSHTVTSILVFAAAPIVMGYFWIRHWPSHAALLNGLLAILFAITLITTFVSLHTAYLRLRKREGYPENPKHFLALLPFIGICLFTLGITAIKVEGIITKQKSSDDPPQGAIYTYYDTPLPTFLNALWGLNTVKFTLLSKVFRPFTLARANLIENDLVGRPTGWLDHDDRKHAFRKEFCKGEDLSPAVCGPIPDAWQETPVIQKNARQKWAEKFELTKEMQTTYFANLENRFQSEWETKYKAHISALPNLNLYRSDLRKVSARGAFLSGADFRRAKLQGAILSGAKLEGSNLSYAVLENAMLNSAKLEQANLQNAMLKDANLFNVKLDGADIRSASLKKAILSFGSLEGANLSFAILEGAYLYGTRLSGAKLHRTEFKGAILGHSPAHSTNFSSSLGLTQFMLKNVIGDQETLLPHVNGTPLYVWSCWLPKNLPSHLGTLLAQNSTRKNMATLRAKWVCSDTNRRFKTGTTKPPDTE